MGKVFYFNFDVALGSRHSETKNPIKHLFQFHYTLGALQANQISSFIRM